MLTIFCDPNYKPFELYPQIEALLFFYERIFLYCPSQGQLDQAGVDWRRLAELVREGFVVPAGREFWFDSRERDTLAARNAGNPNKQTTYQWRPLDEEILAAGPYSLDAAQSQARGYLVLPDTYRRFGESVEDLVAKGEDAGVDALTEAAASLRATRRLPDELLHGAFATAEPRTLAARMAFYTAGDLSLAEDLGVGSVFSTPEVSRVYRAVTHAFLPELGSRAASPLTVMRPAAEYKLTREELRLAERLAQHVVEETGPLDIKLLIEYRKTDCARMFRDFVAAEMAWLRTPRSEDERDRAAARLKEVFDWQLNAIDALADWGPLAAGAVAGPIVQLFIDEKMRNEPIERRAFFGIGAGLVAGVLGKLVPRAAPKIAADYATGEFSTLFLLVRQQRERRTAQRRG